MNRLKKRLKFQNRKVSNPKTLAYTGNRTLNDVAWQLFTFKGDHLEEKINPDLLHNPIFNEKQKTLWLNIHGVHNLEVIQQIAQTFNIHDLLIQDIIDVNQRSKFQQIDQHWYFSLRSIVPGNHNEFQQEQISFLLKDNLLISFQEHVGDHFNHIRERLRSNLGIVRDRGADYLLYLLLEAILDNYTLSLNHLENTFKELQLSNVDHNPSPKIIQQLEDYKNQYLQVKRNLTSIKDLFSQLDREQFPFVSPEHIKYYYELRDLNLTLMDECDMLIGQIESSINLYFSIQGFRTNQIMQTLTIVSTIFIPLTFIAGIYGMNFKFMPELGWKYSYLVFWIVISIICTAMIFYFKRKNW